MKTMKFRKQTLLLAESAGKTYVVMRPVADSMGLDWSNCFARLKKRFSKSVKKIQVPDKQCRKQAMTCLELAKYPAWLSLVNIDQVNPELHDDLIAYKAECEQAFIKHYQAVGINTFRKALGVRHV